MTPSGLHLSSILFILSIFLRSRKKIIKILPILGIGFFTFSLDGLDSLNRMIIFSVLSLFNNQKNSRVVNFLITFTIAIFLGHLHKNSLSFSLSFIFLGVLIFSKSNLKILIFLFLTQVFLSAWFEKEFYPLSSLFGLGLSLTSPIIFLLMMIESILPFFPFTKIWLSFLFGMDSILSSLTIYPLITLFPFFFFMNNKRLRRLSFGLCLLLSLDSLNDQLKGGKFLAPPPIGFIKKVNKKDKVITYYENRMKCISKILGDEWRTYCYK